MLPTRHGLLFCLVLFAIFIASINYNNGLSYGLTFLLASTALISMLHTHRNMLGLDVSVLSPGPVFAGDNTHFRVCVHNSNDYTRVAIWLFCEDHRRLFHIEPLATVQLEVPVATSSRGYITCPPIRFSSAYPLGLLYTWSAPVKSKTRGVVYPVPDGALPLPTSLSRGKFSESGRSLEGDDFAGLRQYAHGDSPRHIHWKAAASHNVLLTKQFSGEASQEIWLEWDAAPGSAESRLSQLCKWVTLAESSGALYGLSIPGETRQPGRGSGHYHSCLKDLAVWGLERQN
jgi:uncharacterized protein (DUF58 family)